jgi:GTP cyclohydrolase I
MKTLLEQGLLALIQEKHSEEEIAARDLAATPGRFQKALNELLCGYEDDPQTHLAKQFPTDDSGLVIVSGIAFTSVCEHHVLPFSGIVSIGYLPSHSVVGLSKLPRAVQALAGRLQIQERLTSEIAEALNKCGIYPKAVAVVVKATHSCACLRGAKAVGTVMTTSSLLGEFRTNPNLRQEFFALLEKD